MNSNEIFNKFLKQSENEGYSNTKINHVIRNKIVVTQAEYEASKKFYNWVLEKIGDRYKIIGGKTWRFGENMLYPAGLVDIRTGLNQSLWNNKSYIHIN